MTCRASGAAWLGGGSLTASSHCTCCDPPDSHPPTAFLHCSLALSLHAPTQELRQTIVPSAKAFKLDRLMAAVGEYQRRTGQSVFVEYVMLGPGMLRVGWRRVAARQRA